MEISPAEAEQAAQLAAVGRWEEAEPIFLALLAREPKNVRYVVGAGLAAGHTARPREAIAHLTHASVLSPRDWRIWHSLGGQHYFVGEFELAAQCFRRAIDIAPEEREPRASLGFTLAIMGDLPNAWPLMRFRDDAAPLPVDHIPIWRGEPLAGKTVLLHNDQAFGDSIIFCRYSPVLARDGARLLLATRAPIRPLLATLEGIARVIPHNVPPEPCDFRCPLMDLPSFFTNSFETILNNVPYLHVDPQRVEAAERAIPPRTKPRVGLIWSGNPRQPNNRMRACAPQNLRPLHDVPGVDFFSVQWRDVTPFEMPFDMPDLTPTIKDFADAAAVLSRLDLLITTDTAFAHLAGAIGMPVWLLLWFAPDWRWGARGETTPWYPTMRLFRQPDVGVWAPTIEQVKNALKEHFPA